MKKYKVNSYRVVSFNFILHIEEKERKKKLINLLQTQNIKKKQIER